MNSDFQGTEGAVLVKRSYTYAGLFVLVTILLLTAAIIKPAAAIDTFFDPHGNYEIDTTGCRVCHNSHYGTGSSLLTKTNINKLCYSCHDGSGSNVNVKQEFGEIEVGSSVYESYHPVPTGVLTCRDCHNPHATPDESPGILSVGESAISAGNAVCGVCHQEGYPLPGSDIVTSITGTPHDSMLGPSSGTNIKCIRCHRPHGSPYTPLIQENIHDEQGVLSSVTGNNNTVCFACHQQSRNNYKGLDVYNLTKHGSSEISDPIKALTFFPETDNLPGMCLNCHEPHGRTGFSKYTRAEGNALCVRCHDDESVNHPINYSYRGIEAYNNTPHAVIVGPVLYNAGSKNFAVWEQVHKPGFEMQTPHNRGQLVEQVDVDRLFDSDNAYLSTGLAIDQGDYNTQMFKFKVVESFDSITKFRAKWIGYGEPTPEHTTDIYIWDFSLHSWELLHSAEMSIEGTVETFKETNITDYINSEGEVYLLAAAKHDGTPPVIDNIDARQTNYDGAVYTARVSWDTNEFAKSWLDYGSTTDYGTTLSNPEFKKNHVFYLDELGNGVVNYRVRSEDALGNQYVSENRTFELRAPIEAPVLIGADMLSPDSCLDWVSVLFRWNPIVAENDEFGVKYNVQYRVQISRVSDFSVIYKESNWLAEQFNANGTQKIQSTSLIFNDSANFFWRVNARYVPYPFSYSISQYSQILVQWWCPVLYTWDGEKYTFVNYIVGGNIGRETAQGRYLEPDRKSVV